MLTDSNELIGKTFGTCTLERQIGHGGMGAVYLARQTRPRRSVAIKVLLLDPILDKKAREDFLIRFQREADAIAVLDHIHIMPVYEYGEQDQQPYLVMPYITGGTLRQVLSTRGSLPLNETLPIIEQVGAALDYAHERGIIHRDIKPGNILFHADGRLLLTDFGLAKVLNETSKIPVILPGQDQTQIPGDSHSLSQGAMIGTPEYLSPEQALGRPIDRRTDIYSLGILLFQMLTGRVPFAGRTPVATAIMHAHSEPPAPSSVMPTISPEIEAVILRAMAKQPAQRYTTADEFVHALRAASNLRESAESANPGMFKKNPSLSAKPLLSNDTEPVIEQVYLNNEPTDPWQRSPGPQQTLTGLSSPPVQPEKAGRSKHPLLITLCALLILLLASGGFFISLQWAHSLTLPRPVTPSPNYTLTAVSPTLALTQPPVPVGLRLYASALLYSSCQGTGGSWNQDANAVVTCGATATRLSNTLSATHYLASIFLNSLGSGGGIPNDYVLQVEAMQEPDSQGEFGILFRNQPDEGTYRHNGAYSFLLNPANNTWSATSYNDKTGAPTHLATQPLTVPLKGQLTIDIVVQGATFTFYLNGQQQGSITNTTYPSGTIGFSVNPGTAIYFSNLAIWASASS